MSHYILSAFQMEYPLPASLPAQKRKLLYPYVMYPPG